MSKSGPSFSTIARLSRPRIISKANRADFDSYVVNTPKRRYRVPVALRSIKSTGIHRLAEPRASRQSETNSTMTPQRVDFASYNVDTPIPIFRVPVDLRSIQSLGIDRLAVPRTVRPKFVRRPPTENESRLALKVPNSALMYRASDRIRQLARPRVTQSAPVTYANSKGAQQHCDRRRLELILQH